jgi:hypothetical protein
MPRKPPKQPGARSSVARLHVVGVPLRSLYSYSARRSDPRPPDRGAFPCPLARAIGSHARPWPRREAAMQAASAIADALVKWVPRRGGLARFAVPAPAPGPTLRALTLRNVHPFDRTVFPDDRHEQHVDLLERALEFAKDAIRPPPAAFCSRG